MKKSQAFFTNYLTKKNTNILYFSVLAFVILIMIFVYQDVSFKRWIAVLGTMVQIMLPCYVLVPILWKKDAAGAWQMIIFMILVLTVTYFLKFTINAPRPSGGGMSFPSGHTVGAFMGSMFLTVRYGLRYFLITTPFALFVGFSRLYVHKHWPIDVIAGIILCLFAALLYVKRKSDSPNPAIDTVVKPRDTNDEN